MDGNFDCTQFLTFNCTLEEKEIYAMLMPLEDIGFSIITERNVRDLKKEYFKYYMKDIFIEIKFDNFIGEIDLWKDINEPSDLIKQFISIIRSIVSRNEVSTFKVILSSFAEFNKTTNEVISVFVDNIEKGLYSMSNHYYDVWTDNLIIEITK